MVEKRLPNEQPADARANDLDTVESASFFASGRMNLRTPPWRPPSDMFETEQAVIVRVEIAGMREADFSIELNGRTLMIRGIRPDTQPPEATKRRAYHQIEIRYGEFGLDFELPAPFVCETTAVQAVYTNGLLVITLPKARPHQISVSE